MKISKKLKIGIISSVIGSILLCATAYSILQWDQEPLQGTIATENPTASPSANKNDVSYDNSDTFLISVPYQNQSENYPTGCEVVSAYMVLNYYGYSVSIDKLIDFYLPCVDIYLQDGNQYSEASPSKAFLGDPRESGSYGCYAPVIADMMNQVMDKHTAQAMQGERLEALAQTWIPQNKPLLVWASINMEPTSPGNVIYHEDGTSTQWISREHCLVLVGYDNENYYFNDPYENQGVVQYPKEVVEARYQELGCQTVVISPNQ